MFNESGLFSSNDRKITNAIAPSNKPEEKMDCCMKNMKMQLTCNPQDFLEGPNNKKYPESVRRIRDIKGE